MKTINHEDATYEVMDNPRYPKYWNGDAIEFTGKTQIIANGLFHEYIFTEGHKKGQAGWTQNGPFLLCASGPSAGECDEILGKNHYGVR